MKKAADGSNTKIKASKKADKKHIASKTSRREELAASESSEYDPTEVYCTICAVKIPDYKPKYFEDIPINPACDKCFDSDYDDNLNCDDEVSDTVDSTDILDSKTEAPKNVTEVGEVDACIHSPPCISRQPFPPPLPSITHLKNETTEYHLHMMSRHGLPGHYGGHERCINAYSKNYGCESCIWFKWNGELYGLPDINPHDYKKYLDPDPTENTNSTN